MHVAPGQRGGIPEHELIAAAQRGDASACKALVRAHQGRVAGQLRAMLAPVGRAAIVEDLAQETFLRAFGALPRFVADGRARLSTWLVTIATRVALNELRRRPPPHVQLDTVHEIVGHGGIDARRGAIERAIEDLSPAYRGAFLLRELEGLEYEEIAAVLEVDVGTVKSRLSRARQRLRDTLMEVRNER